MAQVDGLSRALGGDVDATAVLLTADDATVDNRLRRREFGPAIEARLARSRRAADELDALDVAIRIATDGRTPTDIARQLLTAAQWLDG